MRRAWSVGSPVTPVLPALVPDMSYDGMEVAEGNDAGFAWKKMLHAEVGSEDRSQLRDALLQAGHASSGEAAGGPLRAHP